MESPRNSSSEEDLNKIDLVVEIYSRSGMDQVQVKNNSWSPSTTEIIDFINRRILRGNIDYPIFVEMILTKLVQSSRSEFGNIVVKDGDCMSCVALGENQPGMLKSTPETKKSTEGIFGYVLRENKAIISNSVSSDPRLKKKLPEHHPKIKTILLIPIRGQWVLSLINKKKYSVSDIQIILPLLRTLEKILRRSKDTKKTILERTSQDKDIQNKFLAAMSHDLRTPLNGILGMVTLLPDTGPLTAKQKEYINTIKECTFQMVTLVNNFLDFNKIASENLVLKKESLRIEESIKDSLSIVRGNAINKRLKLKTKIPPNIPILLGDRARITQVLSNLLSNAVKFTEKGKVKIEVELKQISEKGPVPKWKIIFHIKDTGIGIPKEDREKIFEFFKQSSNLNAFLNRSGTGFGLSFSRELVKLMNGEIWLDKSQVGKGSTFTFFIVLEEELQLSREENNSLHKARVLVVDDRIEVRVQLSEILFKWGCHPVILSSAREALSYLSNNSKFDLGMIDICMPQMTGIELAQNLRLNYPHIPLIGISSNEITGGEEYFDYYTYKPIDRNQLFSIAVKCLQKPKTKKRKSKKHLKILIVEDNECNSYTLKEILKNLGYNEENIKIAVNGRDCVDEVKRKKYDVILMDIVMPVMNGIEAAREIQTLPKPPMIIAISAAVMNSDKNKCQEVGISAYLEKPISREKLKTSLLPLISGKKNKRKKKNKTR